VLHDEVGIPGFMVMMRYSYNIVQGEFIGASKRLITDVLKSGASKVQLYQTLAPTPAKNQ
jgi:hypothetical protein